MRMRLKRPDWWGVTGAHLASWAALGPSLLPRTWWTTGASVGLAATFGYAAGSALHALARLTGRTHAPQSRVAASITTATLATGTIVAAARAARRQQEIARLVEEPIPAPATQPLGIATGAAIAATFIGIWRIEQWTSATNRRLLRRIAPALAAPLSGTAVTFALTYAINRSFLWQQLMRVINERASANNERALLPLREAPLQRERSGSAASLEPFLSLGRHGKAIVADGPRAADIAAFWGADAQEPVRAYVGLQPSRSIASAADDAVAELARAGGLDRKHLLVLTGTGTGWVNEWTISAFEFLTRGDCATVSMQYTVLPSALAFLIDRRSPRETARELDRALSTALQGRERPRIYAAGESLGAYGGLSIYADAADLLARVDGAIWAGTPQFTPIWQELVNAREPGSAFIRPVVDGRKHIRFSTGNGELRDPALGEWRRPRVAFLQHASDPVVWWDARLLWQRPQWLREAPGRDVSGAIRWWPWVTHWQLAADMPRSIANRGGHAHRYYGEYVEAWAQVLGVEVDAPRLEHAIGRLVRAK